MTWGLWHCEWLTSPSNVLSTMISLNNPKQEDVFTSSRNTCIFQIVQLFREMVYNTQWTETTETSAKCSPWQRAHPDWTCQPPCSWKPLAAISPVRKLVPNGPKHQQVSWQHVHLVCGRWAWSEQSVLHKASWLWTGVCVWVGVGLFESLPQQLTIEEGGRERVHCTLSQWKRILDFIYLFLFGGKPHVCDIAYWTMWC